MLVNERVKGLVRVVRLDLYGHGLACGAQAIRRRHAAVYQLKPLPSARTIGRIIEALGLTHGRTGWYEVVEDLCQPGTRLGEVGGFQGIGRGDKID